MYKYLMKSSCQLPQQMSSNEDLELTFALKHIDQHLLQNDFNTNKLLKLQQRIILKEKSNLIDY